MEDRSPESSKIFKIEKVEPLDESQKLSAVEVSHDEIAPSKMKFDSALVKAEINVEQKVTPVQTEANRLLSPMAELGVQRLGPATRETALQRVSEVREKLVEPTQKVEETIKQNPDLKLRPVDESALSEKLIHVDAAVRSALGMAGVEAKAVPPAPGATNSLTKFLGYLTHSDKQMRSLEVELNALKPGEITPGKLLAIQIKVNYIQREIEFFTTAMSKALESVKTIMNVQI